MWGVFDLLKQYPWRLIFISVFYAFLVCASTVSTCPAYAEEASLKADLDKSEWIVLARYLKGYEEKGDKDKLYCRYRSIEAIRGMQFCCSLRLKLDMSLVKPYRTSHERYFPHDSLWILYMDISRGESPAIHLTRAPGSMVPYSEQSLKEAISRANGGTLDLKTFEKLKVFAETSGGVVIDPKQFESKSK